MSEKRANMLIKAIVEIEQACDNTNDTHSEIWQIAYDAIRENARMVAEMPANGADTRAEPALPIPVVIKSACSLRNNTICQYRLYDNECHCKTDCDFKQAVL